MLRARLREALAGLAERIDPAHLAAAERLQLAAWDYATIERTPCLLLDLRPPDWPLFPYGEALDNPEKMLWNELLQVYIGVYLRDDRMLAVRPHFGAGTVASLFGAPIRRMGDAVPWVEPLPIRDLVASGLPDLRAGFGAKVVETLGLYRDCLASYPQIRIFLCDTQGPLDTALLLWGPELYMAMREDSALVHALLDLITETTIAFTRLQKRITGEPMDQISHFWYRVPGGVRVVDDVAMNLSPEMYAEFGRPYNERILAAFGGGYMHYCGHRLKTQEQRRSNAVPVPSATGGRPHPPAAGFKHKGFQAPGCARREVSVYLCRRQLKCQRLHGLGVKDPVEFDGQVSRARPRVATFSPPKQPGKCTNGAWSG